MRGEEEKALGPGIERLMDEVKPIPEADASGKLPSERTDCIAFQYPNGKKVTVTMHIQNDNIIAVQRNEY